MKYRASAMFVRVLAYVLAAVCLAGCFLSGGLVYLCIHDGFYDTATVFQQTYTCAQLVDERAEEVAQQYAANRDFTRWDMLFEHQDFRFILINETTGKVVASYTEGLNITVPENLGENPYLHQYDYYMTPGRPHSLFSGLYVKDYYPSLGTYWNSSQQEWLPTGNHQILCLLPTQLTPHDDNEFFIAQQQYLSLRGYAVPALQTLCVCALIFVLLFIFLLCQAGHRPGQEDVRPGWLDKVPLEILLAAGVFLVVLAVQLLDAGFWQWRSIDLQRIEDMLALGLMAAAFTACGLGITGILCSCAVRLKLGRWWRQTLIFGMGKLACRLLRAIKEVPRLVLVLTGIAIGEFFLLVAVINDDAWLIPWFLINSLLLAAVIMLAVQFLRLRKAARAMAEGDLSCTVDTTRLWGGMKDHAHDLGQIARGMNLAVEQRIKSERLKTELITNVSHDIKTPLTSIINYVDLLQKPHSEQEQTQYLEVLARQSGKLKRLTENLVEASKASTGSIQVSLTPINLGELLHQAAGEYRHRMEQQELELVLSQKEELTVRADGKLLWRVLDNLLENAVKYALPGTRVYLTAERRGDCAAVSVKNISRDELNIDADELMERFVRGDRSRHTEGSGLGLNIAQSLTHLQQGDFALTVDGDLFKVELRLPLVK